MVAANNPAAFIAVEAANNPAAFIAVEAANNPAAFIAVVAATNQRAFFVKASHLLEQFAKNATASESLSYWLQSTAILTA